MLATNPGMVNIAPHYKRFTELYDKSHTDFSVTKTYKLHVLNQVKGYFESQRNTKLAQFVDFIIADEDAFNALVLPYVHSTTMYGVNTQQLMLYLSNLHGTQRNDL